MPVSDAHREALRSALAELELEETRLRDQFAELATRLRRATRLAARFGSAHATLRTLHEAATLECDLLSDCSNTEALVDALGLEAAFDEFEFRRFEGGLLPIVDPQTTASRDAESRNNGD